MSIAFTFFLDFKQWMLRPYMDSYDDKASGDGDGGWYRAFGWLFFEVSFVRAA